MMIAATLQSNKKCIQALNFGAGKTFLMTDYDGTYMHEDNKLFYKHPERDKDGFSFVSAKKYFEGFNNFLNKASHMFETIITSGRKMTSVRASLENLRKHGVNIINPQGIIEQDGGSVYRLDENGQFYLKHSKKNNKFKKAFDVKNQLKLAKKNNDLVIAAGNQHNDNEMLNIFNYLDLPEDTKIPHKKKDISLFFEKFPNAQKQIQELPLKIIFFNGDNKHSRNNKEFYDEIHRLFPDKFETVEHKVGENVFLKTIKSSIKTYAQKTGKFRKALLKDGNKDYINDLGVKANKKWLWLFTIPVAVGGGIVVNQSKKKKQSQSNFVVR